MEENKKEIIEKLTKAVKRTREGQCIQNIVYKKGYGDDEIVYINYLGGNVKKVNVTMDSGIAMIRDVAKHL